MITLPSENISPSGKTEDNKTEYSLAELLQYMKILDMDTKLFFNIAANDIQACHGKNAIIFARLMLDQMIKSNNPNGIYLWKEFYNILAENSITKEITLH